VEAFAKYKIIIICRFFKTDIIRIIKSRRTRLNGHVAERAR
jgi:hypothetical protein